MHHATSGRIEPLCDNIEDAARTAEALHLYKEALDRMSVPLFDGPRHPGMLYRHSQYGDHA